MSNLRVTESVSLYVFRAESSSDDNEARPHWIIWMILAAVFIILSLSILAARYCIHLIRLRRQLGKEMKMKNGLIISIGIGEYGPRPPDAEAPGYFTNLPVAADVENLKRFSEFLHYPFVTIDGKLSWTKAEVLEFLEEQIAQHFFDGNGVAKCDGLIVSISSHGLHDCIVSSDYKMINRTDIHRSISDKYPQIREIPRIFLFDACDGTRDRKATDDLDSTDNESADNMDDGEANKAGDDVVESLQMETEWTSRTKNPDYNLIVVHGSNDGFVSKMQATEVGSYLTYCFTKMVKDNIVKRERRGLGAILTEIQNVLHDKGKQMIKFICFNNTGSLRIERGVPAAPTYSPPSLELISD